MHRALDTADTPLPAPRRAARLVLMTADGGTIDVTEAAGQLLVLARTGSRQSALPLAPPTPACPPPWAALCQHLGRCERQCALATPQSTVLGTTCLASEGRLTGRETEVVAHVRQGFTNKEIARRLGIQEDTVKKHLQAVFSKLGVRRRALVALSSGVMQARSAP